MLDAVDPLRPGQQAMPNEGIEPTTNRKTVTGILIEADWTL
jgi:hypothetical protein